MATRVLLIRAVNVGGAKMPMAELRLLLEGLGATDVRTYIASGNAVCDVASDPAAFDRSVERAVEAQFGFARDVMSRDPIELAAALAAYPFEVIEPSNSYVAFLSQAPTPAASDAARDVATGDDRWQVIGRELHICYARGAGRPDLQMDALTRRLGVAATARNLRTVAALVALAG